MHEIIQALESATDITKGNQVLYYTPIENQDHLPRHDLAKLLPTDDLFLVDLFTLGLEAALPRSGVPYGVHFISANFDRLNFEYMTDHPMGKVVMQLEANEKVLFKIDDHYLLDAYGMCEVSVSVLQTWGNTTLYVATICEGEGWWGTLFFSVTIDRQAVLRDMAAHMVALVDQGGYTERQADTAALPLLRELARQGEVPNADECYVEWAGVVEHRLVPVFYKLANSEEYNALNLYLDGTVQHC